ncbi:MAG: hypothetical protein LUM44_06335 [Pyrinomonadaceae bacterium]|nr:hypothetical protein [Pyrinomonadaceae bacterium]
MSDTKEKEENNEEKLRTQTVETRGLPLQNSQGNSNDEQEDSTTDDAPKEPRNS